MTQLPLECPVCGKQLTYTFDEWGFTPFHIHCEDHGINIGAQNYTDALRLLAENHRENTWIEYWSNKIQEHCVNNEVILDGNEWFTNSNQKDIYTV